jgi:hypothetical protein
LTCHVLHGPVALSEDVDYLGSAAAGITFATSASAS